MMKSIIFVALLSGAALLFAALFWPDSSPQQATASARQMRTVNPITTPANRLQVPPMQQAAPPREFQATPRTQRADIVAANIRQEVANITAQPKLQPAPNAADLDNLSSNEQRTFKQTGTDDTSLRDADFPRTYIKTIHVDLTSPNHWVTLTWTGPNARLHPPTNYHSSPGRGLGNNDCDDPAESCRVNSNCTPKGTLRVQSFSNTMQGSPEVRFVTWFDTKRGIALHYYPFVPNYPASHGCVRLDEYAARLIHNNSKIGDTEVVIDGTWTFFR